MRTLRPYLWTLGLLWVLPAVLAGIGYLVLDKDVPPGACSGLGFGCQMSDADNLVFAAFLLWWTVLGPVGVLASIVIALVQTIKRTRTARSG